MSYTLTDTFSIVPGSNNDTTRQLQVLGAVIPEADGSPGTGTTESGSYVLGSIANSNRFSDAANSAYNSSSNFYGFNVLAGGTLNIIDGPTVTLGTLYLGDNGGTSSTDGGRLNVRGSTLRAGRILCQGSTGGSGGTFSFPQDTDDLSLFPTIEVADGGQVVMAGCDSHPYRAFIGNWGRGRVVIDNGSIIFGNGSQITNEGAITSWPGYGTTFPTLFLGCRSDINNATFANVNKLELNGPIDRFDDVTIVYGSLTEPNQDGAIFIATNDVVGNLGAMNLEFFGDINLSNNLDNALYPSDDLTEYWKFVGSRERSIHIIQKGRVNITFADTDTTFEPAGYDWIYGSASGGGQRGLHRIYERRGDLRVEGRLLDSSFEALDTDVEARFAMMNQYDAFSVNPTNTNVWNSANEITDLEYQWFYGPMYAFSSNLTDKIALYGYPSGKRGRNSNNRIWGLSSDTTIRNANRGIRFDPDTDIQLQDRSQVSAKIGELPYRRDLRRFFPFRSGSWQWGYKPEFINVGLGGDTDLTIDSDGTDTGTTTGTHIREAEALSDDIRNGKILSMDMSQDRGLMDSNGNTITNPGAGTGYSYTISNTNDHIVANITAASDQTLDRLYQQAQGYFHQQAFNTSDTYNVFQPDSDQSPFYFSPAELRIGTSPVLTNNVAPTDTDWLTSGWIAGINGNNLFRGLNDTDGTFGNWREGYIYVSNVGRSTHNWAIYKFERRYNDQVQVGSSLYTRAQLTQLIASNGNWNPTNGTTIHIARFLDSFAEYGVRTADTDNPVVVRNDVREYLWRDDVRLRPLDSNANVIEASRLSLQQHGTHHFTKGTTFNTVNLTDTSSHFLANGNQVQIDVSGVGMVRGLDTESSAAEPAIGPGVTISSQLELERGQTYYIAGDISNARLVITGTNGLIELVAVGNGLIPSLTDIANYGGIIAAREESIHFRLPAGQTWGSAWRDSDQYVNVQAVAGPTQATAVTAGSSWVPSGTRIVGSVGNDTQDTAANEVTFGNPHDNIPNVGANNLRIFLGRQQFTGTGDNRVFSDASPNAWNNNRGSELTWNPTAWRGWDGATTAPVITFNQRPGISDSTLSSIDDQMEDYDHWITIYRNALNWAVYRVTNIEINTANDWFSFTDPQLLSSSGVPGELNVASSADWWINSTPTGTQTTSAATPFDSQFSSATDGQPSFSDDGTTLTYSWRINYQDSDTNLYFAFASRHGPDGQWHEPVEGTVTVHSPDLTTQLVGVDSGIIPYNWSGGAATAGASQEAYLFGSNGVSVSTTGVNALMTPVSADDKMTITLDNVALTGTLADGKYLHRLIEQDTNYLLNVARGFFPLYGWTIRQNEIDYTGSLFPRSGGEITGGNVTWQQHTHDDQAIPIVAFDTPVLENGASIHRFITTTDARTAVQFAGALNIGVLNDDQFQQLVTNYNTINTSLTTGFASVDSDLATVAKIRDVEILY